MKPFIIQPIKETELRQQKMLPGFKKPLFERQNDSWLSEKKKDTMTIKRMEETVTLLQIAISGASKILNHLGELRDFVRQVNFTGENSNIPESVVQNFINDKLLRIRSVIADYRYHDIAVLGGDLEPRVNVEGRHCVWIRSCKALRQPMEKKPYGVLAHQEATRSSLVGAEPVTERLLAQEESIMVTEGDNVIQYQPQPEETPNTLITGLQREISKADMNLSVTLNTEDHLLFTHTQFGSKYVFQAYSQSTRIVSEQPGVPADCSKGLDIQGTIGGEIASGIGNFLISPQSNPKTGGIILA